MRSNNSSNTVTTSSVSALKLRKIVYEAPELAMDQVHQPSTRDHLMVVGTECCKKFCSLTWWQGRLYGHPVVVRR